MAHRDQHWEKDNGIVEEVQLNAWEDQLQKAGGDRKAKEISIQHCLTKQQGMLQEMPDLNDECDIPPEPRAAHKGGA